MYQFLASFYNKITNNVIKGLEWGMHTCRSTFLIFPVLLWTKNIKENIGKTITSKIYYQVNISSTSIYVLDKIK
jgi:hypothetical protein